MKVSEAANQFLDYQRLNSKKNTLRNYEGLLEKFNADFGEREFE